VIRAVLVLGIAAVLLLRSRPVTTESAAVIPTAAPTAAPAATAPPTSAPSAVSPPAAAPTAAPIPTRIPPVPARAEPRAAEKRPAKQPAPREPEAAGATVPASRAEWSSRAERDRKRLARERSVRYAIQLELACEVPSLAEAWKHDRPAGTMWLLTTKHGGRDCYRVLWGRYPSLDAAKRAKPGIPAFFTTASNRPAVVSVR
jgi:septal ring-binding cell division protein DamX